MSTEIIPFSDLQGMAGAIAKSGLFGMKTPEQALALMLVAQAEGAHPATITQDYDIIQGKAARKTHSVLARFQKMGGTCEWHELTDRIADATFSHKSGGALRITWTFEQAKNAGLTGKDNWKNYPRAMLRARCIAEGIRAVYPAAIGGMMVSEEAQDTAGDEPQRVHVQAQPQRTERPAYPEADFAANFPKWQAAIEGGRDPAQIVAMIETKGLLSEAQKASIFDCAPVDAEAVEVAE